MGKTFVERESEFTLLSMSALKQAIYEAEKIKTETDLTREKLVAAEDKISSAIRTLDKKEDHGHIFHINGKIGTYQDPSTPSMANDFMNPIITLEEKDGEYIYILGFKKGEREGIKSEVSYIKHTVDGSDVAAVEMPGFGEYTKLFKITRTTPDEKMIDIKVGARMAGPDISEMPATIILDTTSKREEGKTLDKAKKDELMKVIEAEKTTYDEVLANVYKPVGSQEYLKIYDAALKALNDKEATQETVDAAKNRLKQAKDLHLSLNKDKFAIAIGEAEELEKTPEKYTPATFEALKKAIAKANQAFFKPTLTKAEMDKEMAELDVAVKALKDANSVVEPTLQTLEKDVDKLKVTLTGMLNPGATLSVENLENSALSNANIAELNKIKNSEEVIGIYEISVSNSPVAPNTSLTFELGAELNGRKVVATHFETSDKLTNFEKTIENGKVEITVDSLSPFAVTLLKEDKPADNNNTTEPAQPNDDANIPPVKPDTNDQPADNTASPTTDAPDNSAVNNDTTNIDNDNSSMDKPMEDNKDMVKDTRRDLKDTKKMSAKAPKTSDTRNFLVISIISIISLLSAFMIKKVKENSIK